MISIILYWKEIVLLSVVLSLGSCAGYNKIKAIGYDEAATKYQLVIDEQKALIDTKLLNVEKLANNLAVETKFNNESLFRDIKSIAKEFKGKTLTVVKDGNCVPTPTFSDSFTQINLRTNESIKGLQK